VGLLPNLREEPKTSNGSVFSQGRVQGGEMIEKELTKILNAHKKWVQGEGGGRANLREADLREANLWGANLWGANLGGTNLGGANLWGANLWGADLGEANLGEADLREANLWGANLRGANLWGANLRGANLWGANLRGANLGGTNLREANLRGANLWGTNLGGANLRGANLWGADFTNTILPPPTLLLLCNWGRVSDELTTELMRYDATNHPHPHKFQEWADGGGCPYNRGFPRVAHFQECRECWKSGKAKSARELVLMLFKERDIKYNLNL